MQGKTNFHLMNFFFKEMLHFGDKLLHLEVITADDYFVLFKTLFLVAYSAVGTLLFLSEEICKYTFCLIRQFVAARTSAKESYLK